MRENELIAARWRVGRKLGRTIYAQLGPYPSDEDILIGMVDSTELAVCIVREHNSTETNRRQPK
jgi:hypothetical protein